MGEHGGIQVRERPDESQMMNEGEYIAARYLSGDITRLRQNADQPNRRKCECACSTSLCLHERCSRKDERLVDKVFLSADAAAKRGKTSVAAGTRANSIWHL